MAVVDTNNSVAIPSKLVMWVIVAFVFGGGGSTAYMSLSRSDDNYSRKEMNLIIKQNASRDAEFSKSIRWNTEKLSALGGPNDPLMPEVSANTKRLADMTKLLYEIKGDLRVIKSRLPVLKSSIPYSEGLAIRSNTLNDVVSQ